MDMLEKFIEQRKKKLEELQKWHTSNTWSNEVNTVITAYIADSQFVISELEKIKPDPKQFQITKGIELIIKERNEQIDKHGYDFKHDKEHEGNQLATAAALLATPELLYEKEDQFVNRISFVIPELNGWNLPFNWQGNVMINNCVLDRNKRIHQLKIAGAFCAAEIDRLISIDNGK